MSAPRAPAALAASFEPGLRTHPVARRVPAAVSAQRRALALAALILAPAAAMAAGAWSAWPLLAAPMALAMPLGGRRGLAAVAAAAALLMAIASGYPGVSGSALAVAFPAFLGAGLALGAVGAAHARELRRAEDRTAVDPLTGLYNYGHFSVALVRECRRARRYGQPLALVMLDLDGFKAFNDRHGHEAGSRMIARVGEVMTACSRDSDLAVRYGGEEFALLVPGPLDEAIAVAERVRRAVAELELVVMGGARAGITASAGVAGYVAEGDEDGVFLLDRADKALYAAKAGGRNRVSVFAPEHRWAGVPA